MSEPITSTSVGTMITFAFAIMAFRSGDWGWGLLFTAMSAIGLFSIFLGGE